MALAPFRLLQLAERTPAYGGLMDTVADPRSGDVILSESALKQLEQLDILGLMQEWSVMLDDADKQDTPEARSLGALATKNLHTLSLFESISLQSRTGQNESVSARDAELELHGYFSPGLYKSALWAKIDELQQTSVPSELEPARALLLDELYGLFDSIKADPITLEKPTERTLRAVHDWLESQYEDIFAAIPECKEGEKLNDAQIKAHFEMIIASTPALRDQGWRVDILKRSKRVVSVYANESRIVIPEGYSVLPKKLKRLDIHEVLGHALRSGIAASQGNVIGTIGTASYASFEESFMIVLEQCATMEYDASRGIDHYVAAGMAVESHLSTESIARIFTSTEQLAKAEKGLDAAIVSAADRTAAGQLKRTFAGMMDMDDGVAHLKDIDYLNGMNNAWSILNFLVDHDALEDGMKWLLSAKFNPYDADDRALVGQYVPMPECLNAFFTDRVKAA